MSHSVPSLRRWAAAVAAVAIAVAGSVTAVAQIPSPPSTIFGSVTDDAGVVPEHLPVQAYVGETLCGTRGETQFTGEGSARVTVYFVDALSAEQTPGCGKPDVEVRLKIGDRFAKQTAKWQAGPVHVDITFGNATPAAIPTFTPVPKPSGVTNSSTQNAQNGTPATNGTAQLTGTIPAGSPGAGSPFPTSHGGVTSSTQGGNGSSGDSGGGFPLWGIAVAVIGGIALLGGSVGYAMSRSKRDDDLDDEQFSPPPSADGE
jgi:hypothetical protein